jgi:nicotinate-nucleotide pyrophosphorylase (carboxylating)
MNLEAFIRQAIDEDIGSGDYSSLCSIPENATGKAKIIIKEEGVMAGVEVVEKILQQIDSQLTLHVLTLDGQWVRNGDIAMVLAGKVHSILKSERLILNILQRMSGIATRTRHLCRLIAHTSVRLLDTRKTTPNMRMLEKMAVKIGGGYNHRMGLYDMIMLKDNHIDFAGGIEKAIILANRYLIQHQIRIPIEVETRTLEDVQKVIQTGGIRRIMFDNFSVEDVQKAVTMVCRRFETEASGNINETTIADYAATGVDFISVGALTHSVKSLDMSLLAEM